MTEPNPAESADADSVRDAFLTAYREDLEAASVRTLAEYQARFPGHEECLADTWRWLEPESEEAAALPPRPSPAQRIGPYRIDEELGRGAQATVYLAEHESLHRRVALKVLRVPHTDGTSRSEQRFRREAEVTARIEHPNICSVYEAGSADGTTWIAMQYVPGSTLAAHLAHPGDAEVVAAVSLPSAATGAGTEHSDSSSGATRRGAIMRAIEFVEKAARALHVAHERGLVHRDIKPGNLMVTEDGEPVILDFGLARTADRDGSIDGLGLTHSHDVLGTPYYMAPEQLRQDPTAVDRRTDVYAMGVTLYECLTRKRPFEAVSVEALYRQILTVEPLAPRTVNPDIPRDLEVVLQTAMDKDRNRRYQTAADFAEDLRRVRQYEPVHAKPITSVGRAIRLARRNPGVAASLTVAAVSLVVGLVISLVFLRSAKEALVKERDALDRASEAVAELSRSNADLFDTVSHQAALDNVHGRVTRIQSRLLERAEVVIEDEAPGLVLAIRRSTGLTGAAPLGDRVPAEFGAPIRRAAGLSRTGRIAVADLMIPGVNTMRIAAAFSVEPGGDALVLYWVERLEQLLHDLPPTDVRVVRARALRLDCLNQSRRGGEADFATAAQLAREWLQDDVPAATVALYESRLAAASLGLGQPVSQPELAAHVATLQASYPRTWFSLEAMVTLLKLLENTGSTLPDGATAEDYRRTVANAIYGSVGHRSMGHDSVHMFRTLFGKRHASLWRRIVQTITASARVMRAAEVDAFLTELRTALGGALDDDEVLGPFVHLFPLPTLANGQGMIRSDFSDPVVGRFTRIAAEYVRDREFIHGTRRARVFGQHARFLAARGEYDAAREWLQRAEASSPHEQRWKPRARLGACLAHLGDYEESERLLRGAFEESIRWHAPRLDPVTRIRGELVALYRMKGALQAARDWHAQDLEQSGSPDALRAFGTTLLQFHQLDEADAVFLDLMQRSRATPRKDEDLQALVQRARVSLLRGDPDRAIERARSTLTLAKRRATRFREQADTETLQARAAIATTMELQARRTARQAHRVLAQALVARAGPSAAPAAIEHFEAGFDPSMAIDGDGFWSDFGVALCATGQEDRARAVLKSLTTTRGGDPLAWHARARFLLEAGRTDADRQRAVELAAKASAMCKGGRAFMLATLAECQRASGAKASARETAVRLARSMISTSLILASFDEARAALETGKAGNAQWLTVERTRALLERLH